MYIQMPTSPKRLDELALKIGSLAEGIQRLKGYVPDDAKRDMTEEDERVVSHMRALFDIYSDHVEEYDALFIKHMQEFEMWRKSVQENSGLVVFMGPIMPAIERRRQPVPASPVKGHEPPAWTLTDEELAAKSQSELEKVLSGNL